MSGAAGAALMRGRRAYARKSPRFGPAVRTYRQWNSRVGGLARRGSQIRRRR